jgi:hypothetical protein
MHGLREESTRHHLNNAATPNPASTATTQRRRRYVELRTGFTPVCPDPIRDEGIRPGCRTLLPEKAKTCATVPRRIPLATNETIRIRTTQSGHV